MISANMLRPENGKLPVYNHPESLLDANGNSSLSLVKLDETKPSPAGVDLLDMKKADAAAVRQRQQALVRNEALKADGRSGDIFNDNERPETLKRPNSLETELKGWEKTFSRTVDGVIDELLFLREEVSKSDTPGKKVRPKLNALAGQIEKLKRSMQAFDEELGELSNATRVQETGTSNRQSLLESPDLTTSMSQLEELEGAASSGSLDVDSFVSDISSLIQELGEQKQKTDLFFVRAYRVIKKYRDQRASVFN